MDEFLELAQVLRVAVGYRSFEITPNEFIGVKLGRIPGEPMGVQTRVLS
jgi:hypothetical protein